MNVALRVSCFHCRTAFHIPLKSISLTAPSTRRYATHRNPDARLSETLDQRYRPRHTGAAPENVGPFQLGLSPSYRSQQPIPKWSELSTSGKVMRTTARTSNVTVILVGAGLFVLLTWCLTSELLSPNSATVLYGDACDRVKSSDRISKYMQGTLSFHNSPPTLSRPRHRNRQVASQIVVDSRGQEHLLLNFWVTASPMPENLPYMERVTRWVGRTWNVVQDMSPTDYIAWIQMQVRRTWDNGRQAIRFVSGAPERGSAPLPPVLDNGSNVVPSTDKSSSSSRTSGSWFSGMFGSLKAATGSGGTVHVTNPEVDGRTFTEGEAHADLVRNESGYFVYRYLLVDMPDTRTKSHVRIFIERSPGVSEREAVMKWHS